MKQKTKKQTKQVQDAGNFEFLSYISPAHAKSAESKKRVRSFITRRQHRLQQPIKPQLVVSERHGYPKDLAAQANICLHYYLTDFTEGLTLPGCVDFTTWQRTVYCQFALSNQAVLHSLLLTSANRLAMVRGTPLPSMDMLRLRGIAISSINAALQDGPGDGVIAAVMTLAINDLVYGPQCAFTLHMEGLSELVRLRGGLKELGLQGMLERLLLWTDANTATVSGQGRWFGKEAFPSDLTHPNADYDKFVGVPNSS